MVLEGAKMRALLIMRFYSGSSAPKGSSLEAYSLFNFKRMGSLKSKCDKEYIIFLLNHNSNSHVSTYKKGN